MRDRAGDPLASTLELPAPLLRIVGDSTTMINGDCNRALATAGAGKPAGLAILSTEPNVVGAGRPELILYVRDLPNEGLLEWLRPDGTTAATYHVEGAAGVLRLPVPIPKEGPSGLYFLRIRSGDAADDVRVLVVR